MIIVVKSLRGIHVVMITPRFLYADQTSEQNSLTDTIVLFLIDCWIFVNQPPIQKLLCGKLFLKLRRRRRKLMKIDENSSNV